MLSLVTIQICHLTAEDKLMHVPVVNISVTTIKDH